jgi:flavin-dependent dehydrogenase
VQRDYSSKIKQVYDVVIAGAGPAGCMAAYHLDESFSVLMIDSHPLPRNKSCGGALNPYSWNFIRKFGPPESLLVEPQIVNFRYVDWDRRIYRPTALAFHNTLRYKFDAWLLSLLPERIQVADKATLKDFQPDANGLEVQLVREEKNFTVKTRYLIDACGANSRTRVQLEGLEKEYYVTVQYWVEKKGALDPYFDCILMNRVLKGHAYSYIMPKGNMALVGSVFYPGSKGVVQKHEIILETLNRRLEAFGPAVKREAAKALKVNRRQELFLGKGNVLVTGEAAGFISPTSGEGISYALNSGMLCAQAINEAGGNALSAYARTTRELTKNLTRKMNKFAVLEKPSSRLLLSLVPTGIISRVTMKL